MCMLSAYVIYEYSPAKNGFNMCSSNDGCQDDMKSKNVLMKTCFQSCDCSLCTHSELISNFHRWLNVDSTKHTSINYEAGLKKK